MKSPTLHRNKALDFIGRRRLYITLKLFLHVVVFENAHHTQGLGLWSRLLCIAFAGNS